MAPDWPVSRPHGSGSASRPASPFPIGWFPSRTDPDRPVARLRYSGSPGYPDSPAPRAARRYRVPAANTGFPAFPRPGGSPGMVPVSCGESISTPSAPVAQEPAGIHFEFFPRPHLVHRIRPVIRKSRPLSTGFCTTNPQVTSRNSKNASTWSPYVISRFSRRHPVNPRRLPALRRQTGSRLSGSRAQRAPAGRKYDCSFPRPALPWMHDHAPGAEATRVHEPGVAASGCPDQGSGCRVRANRHLPAAAPGKVPNGAVFVYIWPD
jgi:hypothetical protein